MWWSWRSWRSLDRGGLAAMFCGASNQSSLAVAVSLPGSQGIKASRHPDPPILPLFSLSRVSSSSSSSSLHLFFFFLFASLRRLLFFHLCFSFLLFFLLFASLRRLLFFHLCFSFLLFFLLFFISLISSTFQPGSLRPLFLPLSLS